MDSREVHLKHCRRCGARLASDHQDEEFCSPCVRWKRDHEPVPRWRRPYRPRRDVRFLEKLLGVLRRHEGEAVEILSEMRIEAEDRQFVKDGVKRLRRQGYIIAATERVPGYTFLGKAPEGAPYTETVTPTVGSQGASQTPTGPL